MEGDSSCYIYKKKKIKGMEFDQRIKIEKDRDSSTWFQYKNKNSE